MRNCCLFKPVAKDSKHQIIFNYEVISALKWDPEDFDKTSIDDGDYKAFSSPFHGFVGDSKLTKFIDIAKCENLRPAEEGKNGLQTKTAGWKFHLSINDLIEGNLDKGWNTVCPILMKHGVVSFKIVPKGVHHGADEDRQVGKQITIFAFKCDISVAEWRGILEEIHNTLVSKAVVPGPLPITDRMIANSYYISYCNDADKKGRPLTGHDFNSKSNPNPYALLEGSQEGFNYTQLPRTPASAELYQQTAKMAEKPLANHKLSCAIL